MAKKRSDSKRKPREPSRSPATQPTGGPPNGTSTTLPGERPFRRNLPFLIGSVALTIGWIAYLVLLVLGQP